MAEVIKLNNGTTHTLFGMDDALLLIDEYMGSDFREYVEDNLVEPDVQELEEECEQLRIHHRDVMANFQDYFKPITIQIREKEIDRAQLSTAAGLIGALIRRELR